MTYTLPALRSSVPSAVVLVVANLLPLYGVLFLDWPVFPLVVLFWMETVLIGVLNVLRMLCAKPFNPWLWFPKVFLVPFFCVHYGMFTIGTGILVFALFGGAKYVDLPEYATLRPDAAVHALMPEFEKVWLPSAALAASHLFSFFWNYLGRGEFRRARLLGLMLAPYLRVIALQLTIFLVAFGAMRLGSPLWALLPLLGVKIGIDLHAHLKEHRQAVASPQ